MPSFVCSRPVTKPARADPQPATSSAARRPARDDEHDRHGAAGGERPVDRQIGDVEQAEP